MAMNNKGAIWLSAEYNVLNPYYGETMLKCGVVRDTI
jgi:Cu(I)/Ag(I) efflux system membrane fusion protein